MVTFLDDASLANALKNIDVQKSSKLWHIILNWHEKFENWTRTKKTGGIFSNIFRSKFWKPTNTLKVMYSLVNSNFNRTYNPNSKQNALSDIKRLLTSRDTEAQNKACGYLIEVIGRYGKSSIEGTRLVEYLLDNDITVFLCEATTNLDFSSFRYVKLHYLHFIIFALRYNL